MAPLTPAVRFADAEVFHARLRPHGLRFRYSVLALIVDIDRLSEAVALPFFSLARFSVFGFREKDHGPRDGTSLRRYIDRVHAEHALPRPHRVVLTCFPRIFGYVFNPISTYSGFDHDGRLKSVVYEVRNTFGQHHSYAFAVVPDQDGHVPAHECDKVFYVSPFMDMPLRYRFLFQPPADDHFALRIIERDHGGVVLTALMPARVFEATRSALLRRIIRSPFAMVKVLAGIHWQAVRLWLGGHHIRPRPQPPDIAVSRDLSGGFSQGEHSSVGREMGSAGHA